MKLTAKDEVIGRLDTILSFICSDLNIEASTLTILNIEYSRKRSYIQRSRDSRLQCSPSTERGKNMRRKKLDSHDNIIP
jgi:hypothetical protein